MTAPTPPGGSSPSSRDDGPITGAQGVDRALDVLLQIDESPPPGLSLAACASVLGNSKPTTHRILKTLERRGFVHYDPALEVYSLGVATVRLGATYLNRLDLRQVALGPMRDLVADTNETAHLGTLSGANVVYVEVVDSPHPVRIFSRVGDTVAAYATAIGKAILAWTPADEFADHLPDRFVARTERTITSLEALRAELDATARRGYAIDDRENRELITAFAAPVFNHDNVVVAAVSIAGPADRMELGPEPKLAMMVIQSARDISAALGARLGDDDRA